MNARRKVAMLLLLLLCLARAIEAHQESAVRWEVDADLRILAADKTAILKLCRELGLEPARVFVVTALPGARQVYVSSAVVVAGRHRVWTQLLVCRTNWDHCNNDEFRPLKHVGQWLASKADIEQYETWKIQDGDWAMDVAVRPGLAFADTEQIVLAIRHKQMVNRLVPTVLGAIPDVNPDDITQIRRIASEGRAYEVTTGVAAGLILRVRIVGDSVELHERTSFVV